VRVQRPGRPGGKAPMRGYLAPPPGNLCGAATDWWSNEDSNHRSTRLGMRDLRGGIDDCQIVQPCLLGTQRVHKPSQQISC
jgi:hypothetical protein